MIGLAVLWGRAVLWTDRKTNQTQSDTDSNHRKHAEDRVFIQRVSCSVTDLYWWIEASQVHCKLSAFTADLLYKSYSERESKINELINKNYCYLPVNFSWSLLGKYLHPDGLVKPVQLSLRRRRSELFFDDVKLDLQSVDAGKIP